MLPFAPPPLKVLLDVFRSELMRILKHGVKRCHNQLDGGVQIILNAVADDDQENGNLISYQKPMLLSLFDRKVISELLQKAQSSILQEVSDKRSAAIISHKSRKHQLKLGEGIKSAFVNHPDVSVPRLDDESGAGEVKILQHFVEFTEALHLARTDLSSYGTKNWRRDEKKSPMKDTGDNASAVEKNDLNSNDLTVMCLEAALLFDPHNPPYYYVLELERLTSDTPGSSFRMGKGGFYEHVESDTEAHTQTENKINAIHTGAVKKLLKRMTPREALLKRMNFIAIGAELLQCELSLSSSLVRTLNSAHKDSGVMVSDTTNANIQDGDKERNFWWNTSVLSYKKLRSYAATVKQLVHVSLHGEEHKKEHHNAPDDENPEQTNEENMFFSTDFEHRAASHNDDVGKCAPFERVFLVQSGVVSATQAAAMENFATKGIITPAVLEAVVRACGAADYGQRCDQDQLLNAEEGEGYHPRGVGSRFDVATALIVEALDTGSFSLVRHGANSSTTAYSQINAMASSEVVATDLLIALADSVTCAEELNSFRCLFASWQMQQLNYETEIDQNPHHDASIKEAPALIEIRNSAGALNVTHPNQGTIVPVGAALYAAIVGACVRATDSPERHVIALGCYRTLRDHRIAVPQHMYADLMELAALDGGDATRAFSLFQEAKTLAGGAAAMTPRHHAALMRAYLRGGYPADALKVIDVLIEAEGTLSRDCFNIAITACSAVAARMILHDSMNTPHRDEPAARDALRQGQKYLHAMTSYPFNIAPNWATFEALLVAARVTPHKGTDKILVIADLYRQALAMMQTDVLIEHGAKGLIPPVHILQAFEASLMLATVPSNLLLDKPHGTDDSVKGMTLDEAQHLLKRHDEEIKEDIQKEQDFWRNHEASTWHPLRGPYRPKLEEQSRRKRDRIQFTRNNPTLQRARELVAEHELKELTFSVTVPVQKAMSSSAQSGGPLYSKHPALTDQDGTVVPLMLTPQRPGNLPKNPMVAVVTPELLWWFGRQLADDQVPQGSAAQMKRYYDSMLDDLLPPVIASFFSALYVPYSTISVFRSRIQMALQQRNAQIDGNVYGHVTSAAGYSRGEGAHEGVEAPWGAQRLLQALPIENYPLSRNVDDDGNEITHGSKTKLSAESFSTTDGMTHLRQAIESDKRHAQAALGLFKSFFHRYQPVMHIGSLAEELAVADHLRRMRVDLSDPLLRPAMVGALITAPWCYKGHLPPRLTHPYNGVEASASIITTHDRCSRFISSHQLLTVKKRRKQEACEDFLFESPFSTTKVKAQQPPQRVSEKKSYAETETVLRCISPSAWPEWEKPRGLGLKDVNLGKRDLQYRHASSSESEQSQHRQTEEERDRRSDQAQTTISPFAVDAPGDNLMLDLMDEA